MIRITTQGPLKEPSMLLLVVQEVTCLPLAHLYPNGVWSETTTLGLWSWLLPITHHCSLSTRRAALAKCMTPSTSLEITEMFWLALTIAASPPHQLDDFFVLHCFPSKQLASWNCFLTGFYAILLVKICWFLQFAGIYSIDNLSNDLFFLIFIEQTILHHMRSQKNVATFFKIYFPLFPRTQHSDQTIYFRLSSRQSDISTSGGLSCWSSGEIVEARSSTFRGECRAIYWNMICKMDCKCLSQFHKHDSPKIRMPYARRESTDLGIAISKGSGSIWYTDILQIRLLKSTIHTFQPSIANGKANKTSWRQPWL